MLPAAKLSLDPATLDKGAQYAATAAAVRTDDVLAFLDWARLPFYRIVDTTTIRVTDARYGASILIPIGAAR
jgi:hypothetical protein